MLEAMIGWLRDVALTASGGSDSARWIVHSAARDALSRQAKATDLDRAIETALELVRLQDSLEQFVSPRLVAALARETWLALTVPSTLT
jgi:hypothetical protein